MDGPLDEQYLKWLYSQVASVRMRNPARTYWSLARLLYTKEYIWFVPNDDNRAEDGRDLRYDFIEETNANPDAEWMRLGCSMLEMLIGLSRRLAFEAEGEARDWFWRLLENLEIDWYSDLRLKGKAQEERVSEILDVVIWRTYDQSGNGGLFPLREADRDQSKTEVWYQLSSYLLERL